MVAEGWADSAAVTAVLRPLLGRLPEWPVRSGLRLVGVAAGVAQQVSDRLQVPVLDRVGDRWVERVPDPAPAPLLGLPGKLAGILAVARRGPDGVDFGSAAPGAGAPAPAAAAGEPMFRVGIEPRPDGAYRVGGPAGGWVVVDEEELATMLVVLPEYDGRPVLLDTGDVPVAALSAQVLVDYLQVPATARAEQGSALLYQPCRLGLPDTAPVALGADPRRSPPAAELASALARLRGPENFRQLPVPDDTRVWFGGGRIRLEPAAGPFFEDTHERGLLDLPVGEGQVLLHVRTFPDTGREEPRSRWQLSHGLR